MIKIIIPGKINLEFVREGVDYYYKKINKFLKINLIHTKTPNSYTSREEKLRKEKNEIEKHIENSYLIVLDERNVKYESFIFEDEWEWKGSVDEAVDEFYNRIKLDNIEIKKDEIRNFLLKKYGEKIVMKTLANEGVIIWKSGV